MDDYESASKRRERDAKPNDFGAQLAYALSLDRNGRAKDADREFGNALRIDPTNTTLRELVAKRCPLEYTAVLSNTGELIEPFKTHNIDLPAIARAQADLFEYTEIEHVVYDTRGLHLVVSSQVWNNNRLNQDKSAEIIIGDKCTALPVVNTSLNDFAVSQPGRNRIALLNDTFTVRHGSTRIPVPAGFGHLLFIKDRQYYLSAPIDAHTYRLVHRGISDQDSTLVSSRRAQGWAIHRSDILLLSTKNEYFNAETGAHVPTKKIPVTYYGTLCIPNDASSSNRAESIDDLFVGSRGRDLVATEVPLDTVEKLLSLARVKPTAAEEQNTSTYSSQKTHYIQTQIHHPKFGLGLVVSANATKIECDFGKNGIKKLAHNLKK